MKNYVNVCMFVTCVKQQFYEQAVNASSNLPDSCIFMTEAAHYISHSCLNKINTPVQVHMKFHHHTNTQPKC